MSMRKVATWVTHTDKAVIDVQKQGGLLPNEWKRPVCVLKKCNDYLWPCPYLNLQHLHYNLIKFDLLDPFVS